MFTVEPKVQELVRELFQVLLSEVTQRGAEIRGRGLGGGAPGVVRVLPGCFHVVLERVEVAVDRGGRGEPDGLTDLSHGGREAALAVLGVDEVEDFSALGLITIEDSV